MKKFPLYKQPEKSSLCGPTCVQMVMGYFGHDYLLEEITKQIHMRKNGTSVPNIGLYFLKNNFTNVKISCLDTKVFNYHVTNKSTKKQILEMESCLEKNGPNRFIKETIKFLQAGGKFEFTITTVSELKELLKNNILLCRIDAAVLYKKRTAVREAWHFVIPVKITKTTITIHDPSPKFGGIKTYSVKEFTVAFYSAKSYVLQVRK